jgi:hypothetical protein
MVSARFENAVGRLMTRARLLERVLHDPRPWSAVACGRTRVRIPLERHDRPDDHVVLTGYLSQECRDITAVEIWCGSDMVMSWPAEQEHSPVRITLELGIEDTELAS